MVKSENIIVGILGHKGAGKTTALCMFAYLAYIAKYRANLYSNFHLGFPFKWLHGIDMMRLDREAMNNSFLVIDELHEYMDSRASGSHTNKIIADFFLQSRHFACDIFYSTQFYNLIDKRARLITDIQVVCENLYVNDMFRLTIIDQRLPDNPISREMTFCATPIFENNLFDSTERINPFEMTKKDIQKWKEEASALSKK